MDQKLITITMLMVKSKLRYTNSYFDLLSHNYYLYFIVDDYDWVSRNDVMLNQHFILFFPSRGEPSYWDNRGASNNS